MHTLISNTSLISILMTKTVHAMSKRTKIYLALKIPNAPVVGSATIGIKNAQATVGAIKKVFIMLTIKSMKGLTLVA